MALEQAAPKHLLGARWRRAEARLRFATGLVHRPSMARWRSSWQWDARAAGLVAFAETSLLPDGRWTSNDDVQEVAPALLDVVEYDARRYYLIRPLPGQTLKNFEMACEPLKIRWRVQAVIATAGEGAYLGRVVLTVTP